MSQRWQHAARRGSQAYAALMDEALRCACDQGAVPLCVRCACLFSLAAATINVAYADLWSRRGRIPPPPWRPQEADPP
jgi:hypothetical protein